MMSILFLTPLRNFSRSSSPTCETVFLRGEHHESYKVLISWKVLPVKGGFRGVIL